MFGETRRNEVVAFFVVLGIVVGALEGFHLGGIEPVGLIGVLMSVVLISVGILHALHVAEGVFVLEAVLASVLTPVAIEPSVQLELIGIGLAAAFVVGVALNRAVVKTESGPAA